jgi:phage host-nuclease inhibitor protein Gam
MSPAANATAKNAADTAGLAVVAKLTEKYADRHHALAARVRKLDAEFRVSKKRHLAEIIKLAASAKDARSELEEAIEANRVAFTKPKSQTFFGITVGFRKQPGSLSWDDDASVVALIKKHFAGLVKALIKTTEKPQKDAISKLPADDVKKLGVTVGKDTDEVFIKASDSDVDKLVDALLKETGGAIE